MTRILVVEDDAVARDLLREILSARALRSTRWTTARPRSSGPHPGAYDLVVSDIRMERVGGMDVLRAFSEKAPGTPVILITAFGDVTGAMEAIGTAPTTMSPNPFNVEELRQTVRVRWSAGGFPLRQVRRRGRWERRWRRSRARARACWMFTSWSPGWLPPRQPCW